MSATEEVAKVLARHHYLPHPKTLVGRCTGCDWQHYDSCDDDHRAHVSQVLNDAGLLADATLTSMRTGLTLLCDDLAKAEPHHFALGLMRIRVKALLGGDTEAAE